MSSLQSPSTKLRLRVGSFNVHQWTNGHSEHTFDDICSLLCKANLDIIGLQEASRALLPELVSKLGENRYELAAKFGGTVILSRLPVVTIGDNSKIGKGRYCFCSVVFPGDDTQQQAFSIIAVHLNHKKEEKRVKEIRAIVRGFERENLPLPDLWMGDFNALTRKDYTKEEWNRIYQVRSRNHWELPVSDLTLAVMSKTNHKGLGLRDAYAFVPESNRLGPLSTCRFGTRIDYVYFRAERMGAAGWNIAACEHVDCRRISDHNLVIATFEK